MGQSGAGGASGSHGVSEQNIRAAGYLSPPGFLEQPVSGTHFGAAVEALISGAGDQQSCVTGGHGSALHRPLTVDPMITLRCPHFLSEERGSRKSVAISSWSP